MPQLPQPATRAVPAVLALLLVLLSTLLITRTYRAYNQTFDESAHLACGMEWLSHGTYNYEALHPPLARAAVALLPFLEGERTVGEPKMLQEGNALLDEHGNYWKNLTLARLGVLPFFWFACLLVFRFMARQFGPWYGTLAVMLLALCPPVLAHSGLATTDAPLVATYTWSLLAFWRLLQVPSTRNAVLCGIAVTIALLTKFTELPFFGLAAVAMLLYLSLRARRLAAPVRLLVLAAAIVPLGVWAGYRFSFAPIFTPVSTSPTAEARLQAMSPRARHFFTSVPLPADEFFRGVIMAKGTGSFGRRSYLMGQIYDGGKRLFFPVALLVKTPLAMLFLAGAGILMIAALRRLRENPSCLLLIAGAASPLLVGVAGQMNIGLRHVLPMYPFLAMLGALCAGELWSLRQAGARLAGRIAVAGLLGLLLVSCVHATPQFLPYFNEIASHNRDYWLVNSDLDWGQDLFQLAQRLKSEGAQQVSLKYFGDPGIDMSELPHPQPLTPGMHPGGWVAVSESDYKIFPELYAWLDGHPYTLVGDSIRLYHLPG